MSTSFFMQHHAAVKTNCVFEWSLLQMKIASHLTEKPLTVDTVIATKFPPEARWRLVHVLVPDMTGFGLAIYTPSS